MPTFDVTLPNSPGQKRQLYRYQQLPSGNNITDVTVRPLTVTDVAGPGQFIKYGLTPPRAANLTGASGLRQCIGNIAMRSEVPDMHFPSFTGREKIYSWRQLTAPFGDLDMRLHVNEPRRVELFTYGKNSF